MTGSHPELQPVPSDVAVWDVFERLPGLGEISAEQLIRRQGLSVKRVTFWRRGAQSVLSHVIFLYCLKFTGRALQHITVMVAMTVPAL